ncbi:OmpA family protein [Parasphingorhabdus cellanae]|uniref:OmpA family protein n=1 Tax=Parasphingorhabdus cellanae TaxID=2806553 RepID=A0ABX7T782_9SPHN|nr:OmpA family protein [Parasphingorhabdus cellanae]QTD56981.1 OmpA family protein [Parasphingorhabdus cellanae]
MEIGGKILVGVAATVILALVGHYTTGDNYVTGLEKAAQTELTAQGMDGVNVTFSRDPLARNAVLDGDVSEDMKQKALNSVSGITGVYSAVWAGDGTIAADKTDDRNRDVNAAVTQCQTGVDQAIDGEKLSFRSGSAYISPASNKLLDKIAAALKPCSDVTIAVGGHTDNNGNAQVNKILSQERADRVRAGLVERGIPENLVTATGFGAEKPLASGDGPGADAQNRRIEFNVQATNNNQINDAKSQQGG